MARFTAPLRVACSAATAAPRRLHGAGCAAATAAAVQAGTNGATVTATGVHKRGANRLRAIARTLAVIAERTAAALALAAPGAALAGLYGRRLAGLRADPSGSAGTPAETWIALMVAMVTAASLRCAWAAARGVVPRPVGAALMMGLVMAAAVIGLAVV